MKRPVWSRPWILALVAGSSALILVSTLLMTGVLGVNRTAHAAAANNATSPPCDPGAAHSVCTFKGIEADADFTITSSDGCISTEVFFNVIADLSPSATDPSAGTTNLNLDFVQYDNCNQVQVADGFAQAFGVSFVGDNTLSTAHLDATIPVTGPEMPGTGIVLTLSVTWQGFGGITTGSDVSRFHAPGETIITRSNNSLRSASASGTVTDGTTNYAPDPTLNADLTNNQSGQIEIIRS